jgi:hypothetical protein
MLPGGGSCTVLSSAEVFDPVDLTWRPAPAVVLSACGSRAGQLGAAILAWQAAGRSDFSTWALAA